MMVMNDQPLSFDVQDFFNVIRTNVLGPALILRAFLPLLERGKRKVVVNVTSRLGCITQAAELYGAHMAMYATSKAALNMFTVKTACQRPDMIVFALSPGHNSTDSGGEDAPHDPEDTVAALLPFISLVTSKHSGKYWDYWGREIEVYPW
ncbi:hypothetical protein QCA50_011260 [Cerrena zonata]|uniref:Uncharacterized protein n=1 Tax=Cerrena zonata TaxID=2478898 RepID=A0AAW0G1K0_9APHY